MSAQHPACTDPRCAMCVEEELYAGIFSPRDDEEAAVDAGLERALEDIADDDTYRVRRERAED